MLEIVRWVSVAKILPGTSVRAVGAGNFESKSLWLIRKDVGPMNVVIGLGLTEKRRSSLEIICVVVERGILFGMPLNRLRALTGVWLLLGSASASIRRSECWSWQNSLGERETR